MWLHEFCRVCEPWCVSDTEPPARAPRLEVVATADEASQVDRSLLKASKEVADALQQTLTPEETPRPTLTEFGLQTSKVMPEQVKAGARAFCRRSVCIASNLLSVQLPSSAEASGTVKQTDRHKVYTVFDNACQ